MFKARWLSNINFLINFTIEESTLHPFDKVRYHCYLPKREGYELPQGMQQEHMLHEINTFHLSISLSNETSFVSDNLTMLTLLVAVYPFGAYYSVLPWIRMLNQFPYIVQLKLLNSSCIA